MRNFDRKQPEKKEYEEKVIQIDRVSRATKGGQRIRFRVLVVIGNRHGKVGIGLGKAQEVVGAIQKAIKRAKKAIFKVQIINETIPYEIKTKYGSALLMLKPAPKGTSIIAGGTVRAIIDLTGIKNIVSKTFGSANKINNAYATIKALKSFPICEKPQTSQTEIKKDYITF